jgi:hypothetical protein
MKGTNKQIAAKFDSKEAIVAYSRVQHEKLHDRKEKLQRFFDFVLEKCMNSELIVKRGKSYESVVADIMNFIETEDI